jgi:hypothetical protein
MKGSNTGDDSHGMDDRKSLYIILLMIIHDPPHWWDEEYHDYIAMIVAMPATAVLLHFKVGAYTHAEPTNIVELAIETKAEPGDICTGHYNVNMHALRWCVSVRLLPTPMKSCQQS